MDFEWSPLADDSRQGIRRLCARFSDEYWERKDRDAEFPGSSTTPSSRVDSGYLVSGKKVWISKAQESRRMLILVRTTPRDEVVLT